MGTDNNALIILANHDFRDEEYLETYQALRDAGVETKIAANSNEDCRGVTGTTVSVDYTFDEIDPIQYSAIVLIGGVGIQGYLHDDSLHKVVKDFMANGKIVAAICWAPAILANAGVLSGKKATVWQGASEDLDKGGAEYTAEAITVDGNIITANGPDAASQFGAKLAEMIIG
jgi:protease I